MKGYPRECGGTSVNVKTGESRPGSIPASAGEPGVQCPVSHWGRVYPRECGGTDTYAIAAFALNGPIPAKCGGTTDGDADADDLRGLSPRVRGNPSAGNTDHR